ncbi:TRAP transporter substrate-binding protein DctP [Thalassotalea ponticola]|uniref:TRAP transporter substrate-binding protein n=1 Tax=Thalassotalea ponticola TaxID=1523392 RepID=UPI0025B36F50|nr:TRAP transporter substrate-binding protein DctP [Thalassotalea ponticola]MDN3652164.1 TRAP transporter substrate-binding protein DctP [Thalassotalea ponticola]
MKQLITALVIATTCVALTACGERGESTQVAQDQQRFKWKLVTSWPKNFPGLGSAPEKFAQHVNKMSNGRLTVEVFGAGQLVPGFEVFDSVAEGTAEMGHSGAYYWKGKIPAASFFAAVPFGMTASETNAWLHYGGGLELWQKLYKPFGIIPVAGGNSGAQFAGWFNKEINSIADLQGLKMRIGGIGGEVMSRAGALPVNMPGGEIFSSLQSGALDASEWVGPYNDLAFGFHKAAKYYYSTAWQEPTATLEFLINEQAFNQLPSDLQEMVLVAARAVHDDMLNEYTARNARALQTLITQHNVQVRTFPDDVIDVLKSTTKEVINEMAEQDASVKEVWTSYKAFYDEIKRYHQLSEQAYLENRQ